jgi:hypothetical protein
MIEFINTISLDNLNNSKTFKKKLKNEEANIIIYCNKLLFKLNEGDLSHLGRKISNKSILKKIDN